MKILLDECIPRKFKNSSPEHDCRTVVDEVLAGRKNGDLLRIAQERGFPVFITVDRGLEYEQNLKSRAILILLIRASSSRLNDLLPHIPEIRRALASVPPSGLIKVGS